MLASLIIASYMTVAAGNCCTVKVDFAKSTGPIRALHGVNNGPTLVSTNKTVRQEDFARAHIPFMRNHDTVGRWGGTHYVDIPNIFPDFDADENDPKNYDFVFTDAYLAPFVRAGTEIFYRLGVGLETHWQLKRYTTNPPKDFAKWARICEHVVRHYNEGWAGGYRWDIRYWEIWNEPDNPSMWSGTMEQFLDLYEVSAKHLKRCFPNLKIGGYGSCGFYGLNHTERSGAAGAEWGFYDDFIKWYDAFLARCRDKAVPLDFFSFHLYTEDPREHKLHSDYAQGKLNEYGFASTELINDEWNAMSLADDWSDKSKGEAVGKETHASAAYIAAVLSVMQRETTLSKAMFYCARPQDGGFGTLFHANKRPTMAFEGLVAFDKLHQFGMSVRVESSCTNVYALAAKDATGRQRVMLANWTDQARAVTLRLDKTARYQVSRTDEFHARLLPTGEAVADGDTLVIPWKGTVFLDRIIEPPVKVIFDTDMNGDFDDVGALAMLHKYADAGRVEILGTFSCLPVGKSVPVIETLNRWYGRADIPTGAPKLENPGENPFAGYGLFPKYDGWFRHADAKDAPDALAEYRRILAAQPDKSVVICGVGSLTNFANLLKDDPQLVAKKVKRLVLMACKHPEGKECNSAADPAASRYVFENWPTPIEFSDFDFGWKVYSGRTVAELDPVGMNPMRDVFANCLAPRRECFKWSWDRAEGHPSWDQTAVLLAVEGLDSGLWQVNRGKFEMVGDDGTNRWTENPEGPHSRIFFGNYSGRDLGEMIDQMIALPPTARMVRPKPAAGYRSAKPTIAPGKVKVCMDWDDSCFTDFRLAELCRKYKAKATFNITPRAYSDHCYMRRETTERNGTTYRFKSPEGFDRAQTVSIPYLTNKDFKYCYEGFKIAAHLNFPTGDSAEELDCCRQLMEEFLAVAPNVTGQDGFGIVWSGGRWSPGIVKIAKELGFRYCRGANTYEKPGKWGEWTIQPTTYWSEPPEKFWEWYELAKKRGDVFWFWGHTQDLGYDDAIWARLEGIIKRISEDPDAEWIDVGDLAVRRLNRDARFDNAVLRATTDHADALYKVGEKMVFTLKLEGLAEKADGAYYLNWTQQRDDGTEQSGVESFDPSSPKVFETSIDRPGFVRYSFTLLGADKRPIYKSKDGTWGPIAITCECGAGAEPEKLDFPPEPKDFDAFWGKQIAELRKVTMDAKVEKVEIENESVDCYRLSIPCAGGRPATGYMTVPKGPKDAKWPLNISFHGYGTFTQTAPKDGPKDKIDISINAHGYDLDREPEYYREFWKGVKLNERGQYGMDPEDNARPETSYFRGMLLRDVRAVEWAKTLPNWDGKNLRVWGGSQGGMQCFWVAALVDGITELEPIVPWGADIVGKTKGRYSFPGLRLEYAAGLDYYDIVNFAKRIPATCKVNISRAGLGDIHCPPSGQWLLYRAIKAPKSITFLQNSNHGGAPGGKEKNQHKTYSEGLAKDAPKNAESSATSLLGDAWNK